MITPTFAEVIRLAIETELNDVHTAMPCKVLEYHPEKSWVDVRPGVRQCIDVDPLRTIEYVEEGYPIIYAVPICWPSMGGGHITFPIKEGDTGLLICCEQPLEMWRRTGEESGPGINDRHDLNGTVFIPGLRPNPKMIKADPDNVVIHSDTDVIVNATGKVKLGGKDAEEAVALAKPVEDEFKRVWKAIEGHTHGLTATATTPPQAAIAPTAAPDWFAGVASVTSPSNPASKKVEAK